MSRKRTNQLVVRGRMTNGRIELLDDVTIDNGTLLDIVVVETPVEAKLKAAKAKRIAAADTSLRFAFVGNKQLTADPIVFVKRMAKSRVSNVRFDGYRATCHVIPCDLQCAIADVMVSFRPAPAKIAKLLRTATRQRTRFEFNPNTKKARAFVDQLRKLVDDIDGDYDTACNLWFAAISLITGGTESVSSALTECWEFGPLVARERIETERRIGATEAREIEAESRQDIERQVRNTVFDQLKRAAIRSRKKNSSPSESAKLERKELSEIAKRLEAAKA